MVTLELSQRCWIWEGNKTVGGYGRYGKKNLYTHRLIFQEYNGTIDGSIHLHHTCHNKACYNPSHLIPTTNAEHRGFHEISGIAAMHAAKTHCINNHLLPERVDGQRQRVCRTCANQATQRWKEGRERS